MKKKLTLHLNKKLYQRLKEHCAGDKKAMAEFAANILEDQIPEPSDEQKKGEGIKLEDYLKKGEPGSRSYGIKGQGW